MLRLSLGAEDCILELESLRHRAAAIDDVMEQVFNNLKESTGNISMDITKY